MAANLYSTEKKGFPTNIVLLFILGTIIGYFSGVFISGVAGKAVTNPVCGNIVREGNEACDGGTKACTTTDGHPGTQACKSDCSGFETCRAADSCGDNIKNGLEQCDGTDLGGIGCQELGFTSGTPGCTVLCKFNTSSCQ